MHPTIIAHTTTLDAIHDGMKRYDLAENTPSRFAPIFCTCGQRADIWYTDTVALCGRCYLDAIGDTGEEEWR